jgi:hypothetical protein
LRKLGKANTQPVKRGREAKAALGFIGLVLGLDLLLLLDDGLFRRRAHSREGRRSVVVLIGQSLSDLSHPEQGGKTGRSGLGLLDEASRRPA